MNTEKELNARSSLDNAAQLLCCDDGDDDHDDDAEDRPRQSKRGKIKEAPTGYFCCLRLLLLLCALHMQANTCACICDGKLVRLLSCEPRLFVLLLFLLKTFRLCSKRAAKMLSAMPCESKLLNSWAERTRLIDFLCCSYCCCGNMLRLAGTMSVLHKRFPFAHFVILHNRFFTVFAIVVFALPGDLS